MIHLDNDEAVRSYLYEGVCIEYVSNKSSGRTRKYYPDFLVEYVDGRKHLVEIKPKRRTNQVNVQKKLAAAETWSQEHGVTLEVVTEIELRVMGLLK